MNNQLKKLRKIELNINHNLYHICAFVTIIAMFMVLSEFFTCNFFSAIRIEFFYMGVLLIYSLHKEMVRWLGESKVERQGEYFVYSWIVLTTILYVVNFLASCGRFNYLSKCDTAGALRDSTLITLEVLAVFISTRFLKLLKFLLKS